MNCKPDQMAWIVVPKDQCRRGVEQLNGRIVRTIRLLPGAPVATWEVTPEQQVHFTARGVDPFGRVLEPGDIGVCEGIPDHYLRPFDPDSEPEPVVRELEAA
ncbi:MAG: hypothetical protein LCH79_08030 [Proteobacteria bacterium]|nr:hypothetical protein [Pseudomonadota bacterium]